MCRSNSDRDATQAATDSVTCVSSVLPGESSGRPKSLLRMGIEDYFLEYMQRRVWCLLLVGVNADTTPFPYTLRASHSASATTDGNWSDPDDSFEMAVALMAVSSLIGFCVVTIVESCWAKDIEDAKDELLKRRAILEGLRILYEEEESSSSEDAPSLGMEHGVLNLWQPKEVKNHGNAHAVLRCAH